MKIHKKKTIHQSLRSRKNLFKIFCSDNLQKKRQVHTKEDKKKLEAIIEKKKKNKNYCIIVICFLKRQQQIKNMIENKQQNSII